MTRRIDRLMLILVAVIVCTSFANGQARDPAAVKSKTTSDGLVGRMMGAINPVTKIFTEYINAWLIRNRGKQLPCTLYNPMKWDWECTDVEK
ncbi:uncharacterized protein LOC107036452 [Diachasma alloeum]|uniref:uncharacterized protein LOC107036452 n=1 Tax=Diachasma alloeum TaxID=454923 RepID=UPI0007384D06|nr:uncharacterized protein LOC107036452 [Diachasma alloeum]